MALLERLVDREAVEALDRGDRQGPAPSAEGAHEADKRVGDLDGRSVGQIVREEMGVGGFEPDPDPIAPAGPPCRRLRGPIRIARLSRA